jgi:competence protein ComEC
MIPYLKSQGIRVIDGVLISHTDSDHISGIEEILEAMPVYSKYRESVAGYTGTPVIKSIVLPGIYETKNVSEETVSDRTYFELLRLAKEKNVTVYYMTAGDRMKVGKELVLTCLAPEEDIVYADKNAASMVLLATYGVFDMLLTGDMEKEGELRLLEEHLFSSVEVLKVSHHGSHTASSEEFITALQPVISVISCGKDNRYGHPHTETLETLYEANSRVYRTDESGCVTVKVGRKISVEEFKR